MSSLKFSTYSLQTHLNLGALVYWFILISLFKMSTFRVWFKCLFQKALLQQEVSECQRLLWSCLNHHRGLMPMGPISTSPVVPTTRHKAFSPGFTVSSGQGHTPWGTGFSCHCPAWRRCLLTRCVSCLLKGIKA